MAIQIVKGDPFLRKFKLKNETANVNIDLGTWNNTVVLRQNTPTGPILSGTTSSVANGSLIISISSGSTSVYPEGPAVLLIKLEDNASDVVLREELDVKIKKEFI